MIEFTEWLEGLLPYLLTLLGLMAAHVVLAVTVAIAVTKDFQWKKLPEFLGIYVPRVLAWGVIEAFSLIPPGVREAIPVGEGVDLLMAGLGKVIFGILALGALAGVTQAVTAMGVLPEPLVGAFGKAGLVPRKES